ncbi:DUF4160 domain-containing protein [Pararhizobium mangrovi]|uniref:DUF4160 domain-containing protein n=1 Tax=Pararhizobium mangrovi TaxID=2590452 RepID=A0A506U5J0_9HYPH|nr:DUF4160 domain-containing protein [Pararhizobium mangrovi]TPW28728.1 DUF4160 domain-containing protein [Pararhizobium mangrovi]
MPTVLRRYGYRFHFYGSDMNEPPHIHVSGHGAQAKIWLEPIVLAEEKGFKASDLKRILSVASEEKQSFLEAWDDFFRSLSGK